jgi:hypothetical protein
LAGEDVDVDMDVEVDGVLAVIGMVLMTEDEMFFGLTSSASRVESPGVQVQ